MQALSGILDCMKVVAQNRRARYDYEILDSVEAGIMLTGQEAKSCRTGGANLAGSYVSFFGGKPFLKNATIAPYRFASGLDEYNPGRDRPLLLKKSEQEKLNALTSEKGVTIIPLEIRAGRFIKVLLGVARGQKRFDKRQKIKEKEVKRRLKRGEE